MANPIPQPAFQHLLDEDVIAASAERHTSLARDMRQAQLILQQHSDESGDSVYDHMTTLLKRILTDRPPNVIDYFEEYSRSVRIERLRMNENRLRETFVEPARLEDAQFIMPLLKTPPPDNFNELVPLPRGGGEPTADDEDDDEEGAAEALRDPPASDVMHLQFYWQLASFGFPAGHVYLLSSAMRQLSERADIVSCRFWGQMHGRQQSYLIVEAELSAEAIEQRNAVELQAVEDEKLAYDTERERREIERTVQPAELVPVRPRTPVYATAWEYPKPNRKRPPLADVPHSLYQRRRDIPAELTGTGLNRKTYFVCTRLGAEWTELPPVTPQQIQVSRQIRKFLTGNLDAELWSHPVFPGVERNYLRAMIARITAGTYVAPSGYYRVGSAGGDGEEEEEEPEDGDEEGHDNDKVTTPDPGYEPVAPRELLAAHGWTHYRPHILQQGRVNWFDAKLLLDKEEHEGEEEEEEEAADGEEGADGEAEAEEEEEIGPGPLTPCSEDRSLWPMWQLQRAQNHDPSQAMVVMRSLLWPGAVAFAQQRNHDCLYVGWGLKQVQRNFAPVAIPGVQSEYPLGPEIMEMTDPTVEEEDAWRKAHEPLADVTGMEEEGNEGEIEGEPEAEEDD